MLCTLHPTQKDVHAAPATRTCQRMYVEFAKALKFGATPTKFSFFCQWAFSRNLNRVPVRSLRPAPGAVGGNWCRISSTQANLKIPSALAGCQPEADSVGLPRSLFALAISGLNLNLKNLNRASLSGPGLQWERRLGGLGGAAASLAGSA